MKKIIQIIKQSFIAIFRNKGRSFLTILGIIIGIGSVIALIALGAGVKANVTQQIGDLGSTTITILPGQQFSGSPGVGGSAGNQSGSQFRTKTGTLTPADVASLADKTAHPLLTLVNGTVSGSAIFTINGTDQRVSVLGVSPDWFSIGSRFTAGSGRLFTNQEVANKAKVVVLGSEFASNYFGEQSPVAQPITINGTVFTVIGVMNKANESQYNNPNNQLYIGSALALNIFNTETYSDIMVQAIDDAHVEAAKQDIETTLLANHHITDKALADFSVATSADLLSTITNITGILTSLLAGIAAISLVVGGIGIMNIMLVSVTERTREIGLRKAVGAKTSDILIQFIVEAIILTVVGGLLGIGLGYLVGRVASHFIGFNAVVTSSAVLLAVGVSSAVGLIFGIYPAAKAAALSPIDALRYE